MLKTTASTHLAGLAAAGGWTVLLIDADPQGNAEFDLGYESDRGSHLRDAILDRRPLEPTRDKRSGLYFVSGGPCLDDIGAELSSDLDAQRRLDASIRPIAHQFDLIVIDSPPRELAIRRLIMTAAHYLVIPSGVDKASRVGLPDAATTVREIRRSTNPDLEVLGIFAGPVSVTSSKIRERVRTRLTDLIGDPALILETVVRYAPLVAEECRERGILSTEYAAVAETAAPWYEAMKTGGETYSKAADGVATDWHQITDELLRRFVAAQERWALAAQ